MIMQGRTNVFFLRKMNGMELGMFGVTFQWNIWDWLATSYQTAQAEAELRQSEAGVIKLNDAITLDVAQAIF